MPLLHPRSVLAAASLLATVLLPLRAQQTAYEDKPLALTQNGLDLVASYRQQALERLDHFDTQLAAGGKRRFYVVTRIRQADLHEQVFVEVKSRTEAGYEGVIASEPTGPVKFAAGDAITVTPADLQDWVIVHADGSEEGNLMGKAMDLLQAGVAVVVVEMRPVDGAFAEFALSGIFNPQTRQPIAELAPPAAVERALAQARARHGGQSAEDGAPKFTPILLRFPDWSVLEVDEPADR